jgi:SAM-dependent methyltransferase
LKLNKPCEIEDFKHVEAAALIRAMEPELTELYPEYPQSKEHRKSWEYQQIVRGAMELGVLHDSAEVLCFPANHERTVYELSNRARRVFAADVYGRVEDGKFVCDPFLVDPAAFARQPYKPNRLIPRHLDARFMRFDPATFDLVVCPALSAFPPSEEVLGNLLLEFERVLRAGGVLALAMEFVVNGAGAANLGFELYDRASLRKLLSWTPNLELIEEIQENVSAGTLATAMALTVALEEAQAGKSRFPHVILEAAGRQFTTATVFARKTS